ncbi:cyclin-dependent kinase inhibitor 1B-like [Rana temporaria]|uniref:cyclin-dependent kinase inhibitor 1B-like n=1 Tax=Rana temporaria TaxID=8407 RepID=UPI001AADE9DA|nr:cyclin-dependent kinase inhibitor 1B-like [Rana temporaria]
MATFNVALQEDGMPVLPRLALSSVGRGVCRSLFGPIDHDELRSELKRQLKEIQASDCQRWNFDFEAGAPLKGTLCWEPLESKEMPLFYRESRMCPASTTPASRQQQQTPLCARLAGTRVDIKEDAPTEAVSTRENPKRAKENADKAVKRCQGVKGPSKVSTQLRKRESCLVITDFFPKRKRQVTKINSQKAVNTICTLEQTPRKKIR